MDVKIVFGTNVKKYRIKLGLSQEELATKCGLHRTYISSIECFKRGISINSLKRIADALEVNIYELFIEDEDYWYINYELFILKYDK